MTFDYRGYLIEYNLYGAHEYTVVYDGDDIWFNSYSEATNFIDEMEG